MSSLNKHIDQFLEYYYNFEKPPEYAVLLKGKWGVGKTWFIKKSLAELKLKQKKFLYVSLYGVQNTTEIEDEFFKQLHPLLSSNTLGIASKIAKGLLKTTIKIDIDNDNQSDATLNSQIPDIELPHYLTNTDEYILIFDDLERCSMGIKDILGYINHFVEHQGYKVIVVANDEQLIKKENEIYQKTKEKLIGKTFEISPDFESALNSFIKDINNYSIQKIYQDNSSEIKELFVKSKYKNLRHLKQSLWEFERLCQNLHQKFKNNKSFLLHFLKLFLCFSFEIRSGNLLATNISKLPSGLVASLLNQEGEEKDKYEEITKKYGDIYFGELLLEETIWVDILDRGYFNYQLIEESLLENSYFKSESKPNWMKLWHYHDLTDKQYEAYLQKVSSDFFSMKHTELGVVKHLVGLFLHLSEIKLIIQPKSEILNFSKEYIDHLKRAKYLPILEPNGSRFREQDSWAGLGFMGKNMVEFTEFLTYTKNKRESSTLENYPDIGRELLILMGTDTNKFYCKLTYCQNNTSNDSTYFGTPILCYIEPISFISKLLSISPTSLSLVFYALENRYKDTYHAKELKKELIWLKSIRQLLSIEIDKLDGKLSGHRMKGFLNNELDTSIQNLKDLLPKKGI